MARMGGPGRPPKKLSSKDESVSSGGAGDGGLGGDGPTRSLDSESDNDSTTGGGIMMKSGGPDHTYTAPQWLLLHEKQTPRFFSVPIPPVDATTLQAVQQVWAPESVRERKLREEAHRALETIRQLQNDQKTQAKRIKHQTEKLSNAMTRKEIALEEIRSEKEKELQLALKEMEKRVREEQEVKFKRLEENMKKEIQEKYEKDFEADQTARKRKMEEESMEKAASLDENKERVEPELKKELESDRIKVKVDELQATLDKLQEKKSEMVWLLKEVIKADTKRKLELLKLKEAAASTGP